MAHSVYINQKAKIPFSIEAEFPLQTDTGHQRRKNNSFFRGGRNAALVA